MYISSIRRVNATHFFKLSNISRTQLAQFFSYNQQVSKQMMTDNAQVQETYIDFENVQLFCCHFKLSEYPINELIKQERAIEFSMSRDHENADIYNLEGIYNFENMNTCESEDKYQKDFSVFLKHSLKEPATFTTNLVVCNDFQAKSQHADFGMNINHYSQYIESSYKYESFLASANQSFKNAK